MRATRDDPLRDGCFAAESSRSLHSFDINIYIRAFLLPELFPNSFPDVNTVCPRDPPRKPSGTRRRNWGSRGGCQKLSSVVIPSSGEEDTPRSVAAKISSPTTSWSPENSKFRAASFARTRSPHANNRIVKSHLLIVIASRQDQAVAILLIQLT